jgi:hypothetical protein
MIDEIDVRTRVTKKPKYVETITEYLNRGGQINGGPCPHPRIIEQWKKDLELNKSIQKTNK